MSIALYSEERLLRAAKARITRMVKEKSRRKDLQVPPFVKEQWESGKRTEMAQLLQRVNFDKVALMQRIIGFIGV